MKFTGMGVFICFNNLVHMKLECWRHGTYSDSFFSVNIKTLSWALCKGSKLWLRKVSFDLIYKVSPLWYTVDVLLLLANV